MKIQNILKWLLGFIITGFLSYQGWLGTQIVAIKTDQATIMERTSHLEYVNQNTKDIAELKTEIAVINEKHSE